ncbi:unnamed protein product [Pleuronectes platessa]|uniref:Uncharacterized protein n=1 Tax=Pleuronectes platessa TaxID=8262 RepID=A0A9N7VDJ6_PLEPL|nr:unnamed protein product [Pleuronectes platessa]
MEAICLVVMAQQREPPELHLCYKCLRIGGSNVQLGCFEKDGPSGFGLQQTNHHIEHVAAHIPPPISPFHPVQVPFTGSLLKPGKKAQQQQLATLFTRAGIEGLGVLCMSEPHSSSSIQLRYFASAIHRGPTLSGARECREKGGITLFSLCTLHSHASLPKASANELASVVL